MSAGADDRRPVLFVTGHVSPDRVGALAALHQREGIELALFGGRVKHGPAELGALEKGRTARARAYARGHRDWDWEMTAPGGAAPEHLPSSTQPPFPEQLPFPSKRVRESATGRLAASGRYRAVVCSTGGRVALPASWAGARWGRVPVILWASLWAHPRSAVHALSYLALRRLYRSADAMVTYGPHVSAYVTARGARNVYVAPQSVDNAFWSARLGETETETETETEEEEEEEEEEDPPGSGGTDGDGGADRGASSPWPVHARVRFLFAGRAAPEKGIGTLLDAWRRSGLGEPAGESKDPCALALVGVGRDFAHNGNLAGDGLGTGGATTEMPGVTCWDAVGRERLRELYARADVLVVPSIATRTFREPWGLVVNEAMNRSLPVICSDAVGAAAGGLVRDGHNGLVVAAGDGGALAGALRALADDAELRGRLGAAGGRDVRAYSHEAWAEGFSGALATVGLSRERC